MEKTKTVQNRWTKKPYQVVDKTEKNVTLQRKDGTRFTISKKEYFSNYIEKYVDNIN